MNEEDPMATLTADSNGLHGITIPVLEDMQELTPDWKVLDRNSIVGFDNRDSRARPFNLLRTQIAKRLANKRAKLVGITSAAPNAGKSFLSLNLAASLSRVAEQQVILVDLDLRRGSVAEALGMTPDLGISDFLDGTTDDLGSLGWRIDSCKLAIFPTNRVGSNSAELLAGDRYNELVAAFRKASEQAIILFDLPPAFANDDTMIAIQKLDGYVMVVDSGITTSRQVRDTLLMLEPATCLGAVLNRYSGGVVDHYGYGYGYKAYAQYDQ